MSHYTDMVTRPRHLNDTIVDLMGGNFTHAVIQHAVAELKRLDAIRRNIGMLRAERAVTGAEMTAARANVAGMVKSYLAHEIATHITASARFTDEPRDGDIHVFCAEAMMVPMALYDAMVPPLPKTSPREQ